MRKVIIFCVILLLILCIAPFIGAGIANEELELPLNTDKPTSASTPDDSRIKDDEYILNLALSLCDESFCDEALKAALCIAQNNYRYYLENNINKDNISTAEVTDKFYQRAQKIYSGVNLDLKYQEKYVYIPTANLTNGKVKTDSKYPYIKAVASPWDCLSSDYIYGKEYSSGISMFGINYLCESGLSYKEALKWYLPNFDIK